MNCPKISVVMPSYNQGTFIEDSLRSVLDQNYPDLEFIIIDGGSTDNSVDIIKKYEDRLAYWVSEPDKGQTDALIKGFSRATGEILCWLNSDDLYEPYTLHTVAKYFLDHPDAEFVFGNCYWVDEKSNVLFERREIPFVKWVWLYAYNYIPQPAAFWKGELYRKVGGLDPNYKLSMDGDLFARFSNVARLDHIQVTLARFRYYAAQRNQRYRRQSMGEDYKILCRELGRTPSIAEQKVIWLLAKMYRWISRNLFKERKIALNRISAERLGAK